MRHPYLNFSESTDASGYIVGTSNEETEGNGLLKKNVKIVNIPAVFNSRNIVEIGCGAFGNTGITSVFISKNIKRWGCSFLSMRKFGRDSLRG